MIEDPENASDKDAARAKLAGLNDELRAVQGEQPLIFPVVDAQAIAEIVEGWTGIPAGRMRIGRDPHCAATCKNAMERRLVGQPHALEAVARAIHTSRAQLTDPQKADRRVSDGRHLRHRQDRDRVDSRRPALRRRAEPDRHQHERVQGGA